jgi:hypothetical protein
MSPPAWPSILIVSWFMLVGVSYLFFMRYRDTAVKTAVYPYALALVGATFLALSYVLGLRGSPWFLELIAVIVIMYVNHRQYRLCRGCGRVILRQQRSCPRCGAQPE